MTHPSNGTRPGLDREARLLLAACGVGERDSRWSTTLGAVHDDRLDWTRLVRWSLKNRVLPLLYDSLRRDGIGRVPEEDASELRHYYRNFRVKNLISLQELLDLLELFGSQGIRAMPYKGPILAQDLYGDLGLRQFYDLDVLVERERAEDAIALLRESGYEDLDDVAPAHEVELLAKDCELHFRSPTRGIAIELHWDALPERHRFGFEIRDFWERLVPGLLAGKEVSTFSSEDYLLILCIHGGEKHRWNRLQMLVDVARLLERHPDLRWEELFQQARSIDREGTLLLGVYLAWLLLDAPLPEPLVQRVVQDAELVTQAGLTLGRIFREDSGLPSYSKWRAYLADLVELGRTKGCLPGPRPGLMSYVRAVSRPEWTDRQARELPRPFLYYLYRPLRLLQKHGSRLFGRI